MKLQLFNLKELFGFSWDCSTEVKSEKQTYSTCMLYYVCCFEISCQKQKSNEKYIYLTCIVFSPDRWSRSTPWCTMSQWTRCYVRSWFASTASPRWCARPSSTCRRPSRVSWSCLPSWRRCSRRWWTARCPPCGPPSPTPRWNHWAATSQTCCRGM